MLSLVRMSMQRISCNRDQQEEEEEEEEEGMVVLEGLLDTAQGPVYL